MKILMTGATGFVGKELGKALIRKGHELFVLTRNPVKAFTELPFPAHLYAWPTHDKFLSQDLKNIEIVIHLAGESVASRWTAQKKKQIEDSRVLGTQLFLQALQNLNPPHLKAFLFASAVGYYGEKRDDIVDEGCLPGTGFLAEVCQKWEQAMDNPFFAQIRKAIFRIGMVLGKQGGALEKILPVFQAGLGGKLGNGKQWMNWIHLEDLVQMFVDAVENQQWQGVFNAVAPEPVINKVFTETLAQVLEKRAFCHVPSLALKLAFGEMAQVVLASLRVVPKKIESVNFKFSYPQLSLALQNLVPARKGCQRFIQEQWIPKNREEIFSFFSAAENLEKLTPSWLNFHILSQLPLQKIEQGSLIDYRLKLHGIPIRWRTLIESFDPPHSFADIQLKGPYQTWHHTHFFESMGRGTLMIDEVYYQLPLGKLGQWLGAAKVKSDIKKIFQYRREKILELF